MFEYFASSDARLLDSSPPQRFPRMPGHRGLSLGMAFLAVLCLPCAAQGNKASLSSALLPDFIRVQLAGASGLLSVGAGYSFWDGIFEPGLMYGYLPEGLGGLAIHTLAQKSTFSPAVLPLGPDLALHPVILGYAANFALGKQYRLFQEEKLRGYYWPSALHFWIFTGAGLRKDLECCSLLKAFTAVMEIGTLEAYLFPYLGNDSISLGDILSLALAVQIHL